MLRKANNDVFFEAERLPGQSVISANWIGVQSMETVVMGGNQLLAMLKQQPSLGILNNNHELVGPWDLAVKWLAYKWAPEANKLGVKYFAHVLSHGIYGRRSFEMLEPLIQEYFETRTFEDENAAEMWLNLKLEKQQ